MWRRDERTSQRTEDFELILILPPRDHPFNLKAGLAAAPVKYAAFIARFARKKDPVDGMDRRRRDPLWAMVACLRFRTAQRPPLDRASSTARLVEELKIGATPFRQSVPYRRALTRFQESR